MTEPRCPECFCEEFLERESCQCHCHEEEEQP